MILFPLSISNEQLLITENNIFNTNSQSFRYSESRSVQKLSDQQRNPLQLIHQHFDLSPGQYNRQLLRALWALNFLQLRQFFFKHSVIQKHNGRQRLVLCRSCAFRVADRSVKKTGNLFRGNIKRICGTTKFYKPDNPPDISLLGPVTVISAAEGCSQPGKKRRF